MALCMAFFKSVQMLLAHCISRSHRLDLDIQDENLKSSCPKPQGIEP